MLFRSQFGMIYGTNLLTRCPVPVPVFCSLPYTCGYHVSIIFYVPCLIIYQCHMFLYHFGMIYGTNLLTRCPVPVPVFCCLFVSEKLFCEVSLNALKIYGNYFQAERSPEPKGRLEGGQPPGATQARPRGRLRLGPTWRPASSPRDASSPINWSSPRKP